MAAPQNFRSALNGFNREDVVHYLEYLNTRHSTELNKLKLENEALQAEVTMLRGLTVQPADNGEADALRQKLEELQNQVESLRTQLAQVTAQRDEAAAACA